jgi:hypothetical protein
MARGSKVLPTDPAADSKGEQQSTIFFLNQTGLNPRNSMQNQTLLSFEHANLAARKAAEVFISRANAEAEDEERPAQTRSRWKPETIRRDKIPDQVALCGPYFYNRSPYTRGNGNFWRNCVHCGKPLRYFDTYEDAQANNRECSPS